MLCLCVSPQCSATSPYGWPPSTTTSCLCFQLRDALHLGEGTRATDTAVVNRTSSDNVNGTSRLVDSRDPRDAKVKPWRKFKRALKATVGAGCAASAAVLLSNSDDLGEWLQSVAPRVMPNAEAGADIVMRAIEASKVCFEEGVNICLDAEGQFTFLCESS